MSDAITPPRWWQEDPPESPEDAAFEHVCGEDFDPWCDGCRTRDRDAGADPDRGRDVLSSYRGLLDPMTGRFDNSQDPW